jgi:TRAP-type C4-dicarboxylate transport system permease small subunit
MAFLRVTRIFDKVNDFLTIVAGVMLVVLMLIVSLEVVLRYFFSSPTSWVVEISEYILLFIPFLVGARLLRHESHVKMDLLLLQLGRKSRAMLNTITSFLSALICAVLFFFGVKVTIYFYSVGYKTPTVLRLPKFMLIFIIFVGMFLLSIQFIRRGSHHFKDWQRISKGE